MAMRRDHAGWAAGTVLAVMCAAGCGQTAAPVPTPTAPSAKATGQTAKPALSGKRPRPGSASSDATVSARAAGGVEPRLAPASGVVVDQVIGVVNGDLILESDIDEERRFETFEPFSTPGAFSRDRAIERLIDRTLILQQAKLQPDETVTLDEAKAQLETLRKDLPACKEYHCETEAGWDKLVHEEGFTRSGLERRWQQRMEILKFIEMRFRSGIEITPEQIKTYYETKMVPQYGKSKPPKLADLSDRIQEILLEEQVNSLLGDWLTSLKAQGTVRMMRPGEVLP